MFDVLALTKSALNFSRDNKLGFGFQRCRKIVLKEIRAYEREMDRRAGLCFETSDDYRSTTHSDPTGEQAVRNVIRSMLVNA